MDINQIVPELGRLLIPGRIDPARQVLGVVADVWLYILLVLAFIVLFMQPEGSLVTTLIMAAVILSIFMDKVQAFGSLQGGKHICSLGALLIRAVMFLGPLIVAGVSNNPKSRAPAVIGGLLAGAYLFALWFFEMNTRVCPRLERDITLLLNSLGSGSAIL